MEPINDELLIRYLLGETSEAEGTAVGQWLKADPDHARKYAELKWVWESSKKAGQLADPEQAWQKFVERRDVLASNKKPIRNLWSSPWIRVAASLTLLIAFVGLYALSLPHGGKAYFTTVYLESGDAILRERLLDGSEVILNKHSSLSYTQPLFSEVRKVELISGEAYFDVIHLPENLFTVTADELVIRVLGTAFNVSKQDSNPSVTLDRGVVGLVSGRDSLVLAPGEMGIQDRLTGQLQRSKPENELYKYYVNNLFIADNIPLETLVQALRAAYGVEIEIPDQALRNKPITTTLPYGNLDQNINVISETLELQIIKQGNKIILE
jgi:transmembrane sensor